MRSQHLPMDIEAYHRLPWKLGWKYEYWNGQVHITPRYNIVKVSIEITPRPVNSPFRIRAVENDDEPELTRVYLEAFGDTIEYCDWESEKIADSARDAIQNYFPGKRGIPLPASRVAIHQHTETGEEALVGAALIVEDRPGVALLDILFISPAYQRQGVATALVSVVMNVLYDAGFQLLESRYMLGNDPSLVWHRNFGFQVEPDLFLARLYRHYARHELELHELIGDLTSAQHERLLAKIRYWDDQVKNMERLAKKQGLEAVAALT